MKRLNEKELDARIHNFLERKFREHPELRAQAMDNGMAPQPRRSHNDVFRGNNHLVLRWHMPRIL